MNIKYLAIIPLLILSSLSEAACTRDTDGAIDVTVQENMVVNFGTAGDQCSEVPDFYKVKFYRIALCTSDPYNDANSFSSCQYILDNDSGIDNTMTYPNSDTLDTGNFTIPSGDYKYAMLILDNQIYLKHTETYDVDIYGYSASATDTSAKGKVCWTNEQKTTIDNFSAALNWVTTTEAAGIDQRTIGLVCGAAADANPLWAAEIIDNLCHDADGTCGDTAGTDNNGKFHAIEQADDLNGTQTGGIRNVKLLQADESIATSRNNARKILYTITFTTPLQVDAETANFDIAFNLSGSVSIDMGWDSENSKVIHQKVGADMFTAIFTLQ